MRSAVKYLLLLALWGGIFALVMFLYDAPMEAALYAFLLCLAVTAVFWAWRAHTRRKKLRELERIRASLPEELPELPKPSSTVERRYGELVTSLKGDYDEASAASYVLQREMLDYYTMWAHQIKTPIAAMHLLLQTQQNSPELDDELFRIEQYVEMVLGYQRLTGQGRDLLLRRQSLDNIVRQCVRKYAKQFIRKKLALEYEGTDMQVLTDEKWLCFVIEQLLSNALKYTPNGKITITATGTSLTVTDTGIGIRPEDLPMIFQRGYTGYNGRADKSSTGVGLYMCKKVCVMLGHEISVTSELGRGTSVTVDFPDTPFD